eukprot:16436178-Heterocapsa_arctica.AAC.1
MRTWLAWVEWAAGQSPFSTPSAQPQRSWTTSPTIAARQQQWLGPRGSTSSGFTATSQPPQRCQLQRSRPEGPDRAF